MEDLLKRQTKYLTLKYSINYPQMNPDKKSEDLNDKIKVALDKAIQKIIAEEKARDRYLVISDKKGGVTKVPAKDL